MTCYMIDSSFIDFGDFDLIIFVVFLIMSSLPTTRFKSWKTSFDECLEEGSCIFDTQKKYCVLFQRSFPFLNANWN